MTNQAFVKALRGPEGTPDGESPLSCITTAIRKLHDMGPGDDDPAVFYALISELESLRGNLRKALAAHDAGQPDPDAMRCAICGWTVDTSQPPVRPSPPRKKPEVVMSAEALAAAGTLEKLAF